MTAALLDLLDYRRQMAELYRSMREMAVIDPQLAWQFWRTARDRLFASHLQTALPQEKRRCFCGLSYFDYDPALRFTVPVTLSAAPVRRDIATATGGALAFSRFGRVSLPFADLELYWFDQYGGGVFLPFRDRTNGTETYAGGRYLLDTTKSADLGSGAPGTLILDFNFSYNPSCAYDPKWPCPLSPAANTIDVAVRAGERRYV
jgi:uncharacterized protein